MSAAEALSIVQDVQAERNMRHTTVPMHDAALGFDSIVTALEVLAKAVAALEARP